MKDNKTQPYKDPVPTTKTSVTIEEKPEYLLKNVSIVKDIFLSTKRAWGNCYGNFKFPDGTRIHTSSISALQASPQYRIITENSVYLVESFICEKTKLMFDNPKMYELLYENEN